MTEKEKAHFYKRERWCSNFKRYKIHYVFNESWRYVLRVSPYMITHTKMVDSDLESQIQLMDNYIVNHYLRNKINKIRGGFSNAWKFYRKENPKEKNLIKNENLNALYQQYADEMI